MKKYQYRRQLKCLDDDIIIWEDWSKKLFLTKGKIKKIMKTQLELKNFYHLYKCYKVINYEIKEVEISNLEVEGIVSDWHLDGDDCYAVNVGKVNIADLITSKFEGQRVRIKIEVIE